MSFDTTKWNALIAMITAGKTVWTCQYHKLDWGNGAQVRYVAASPYSRITGFRDVRQYTGGQHIEARITGDAFPQYEINGDIRTDNIEITLDDADGAFTALFDQYGAAKADIFVYYPQVDLNWNDWFGQLLPPLIQGRFQQKCLMTNGYRTRELFLPSGPVMPEECPATYGYHLDTLDKVATNLCPSDIHLPGGTMGNAAKVDCIKTEAACVTRLGHKKWFPGVNLKIAPVRQPLPIFGVYKSLSKGNSSIRNTAASWVFGTKVYRGADLILMRQLVGDNNRVATVWRVAKGEVASISNVKVRDKVIAHESYATRTGKRGQTPFNYASTMPSLSGLAAVYAYVGPNEPGEITIQSMAGSLECTIKGENQVAVWTDSSTFTRKWTDDRVWCLLEMYTNQTAGLKYEAGRFWIDDYITASTWSRRTITHTFTTADGDSQVFARRRTTFDVALNSRPAIEQVVDVCRTGRISIPFQYNGKYTVMPFRVFTSGELSAARVFTDYGTDKNIVWTGEQSVTFEQKRLDALTNEIAFTFDEALNFDIPRTIYVDDPETKAKASKIQGNSAFSVVPKQYVGVGIRHVEEAVPRARWLLYFGEYDAKVGPGIKNNCIARFNTTVEWALGLKKYSVIKLDLETQAIPDDPAGNPFVYFVLLEAQRVGDGLVSVTALAYNQTEMEAFEVEGSVVNTYCTINADCPTGTICVDGICEPIEPPPICPVTLGTPTYSTADGLLRIPIDPC